jgi:RHS repeat-associated protein
LTDRRWLHADERGSVVAVSDGTGMVTTINRYDEYGIPQGSNAGRFQYTGQAWISKIGMYYYKARMYSPTLGRFMQTDPIGYADGMNWYNYVGSDPVNNVDPSGLIFVSPTRFSNIGIPTSTTSFDLSVQDLVPGTIVTGSALYNPNPPTPTVDSSLFNSAQNQITNALTTANNIANGVGQGNGGPKAKPATQSGNNPCNSPLPDGSTINQNVDAIRQELLNTDRNGGFGAIVARWKRKVSNSGAWDYKLQRGGSDTQGNMNYGATGALLFPESILLRVAGYVQGPNPENSGSWWDFGPSSYGDQPRDQANIRTGVAQCRGTGR